MLFTSYQFILFVLVALILYYVVPKRIQWIVLLCMNMLFYVYAGLSGIIFIVTTIVTTYAGARLIYREKDRSVRFIEEHKCDYKHIGVFKYSKYSKINKQNNSKKHFLFS